MNLTPIARATTLRGLIKACMATGAWRPWVLLHPLTAPAFLDGAGVHAMDPLSADQIVQLSFPRSETFICEINSLWKFKMIELLTYQFRDVAATKDTRMIWADGELVAVIGVGTTEHSLTATCAVVDEIALSLKRIRESEFVRQQLCAHQHLKMDYRESILIVREDGRIELSSESGWDALHAYMRRRPNKKDPVIHLPSAMIEVLLKTGKTILGEQAITVYALPGTYETLFPLKVVFLEHFNDEALTLDQRVAGLTTSQRAAYNLILAGKRNKEIAEIMGVTFRSDAGAEGIHHPVTVRDDLKEMTDGSIAQPLGMKRRWHRKAALNHNSLSITVAPMTDGTVDVESLLSLLDQIGGHRNWEGHGQNISGLSGIKDGSVVYGTSRDGVFDRLAVRSYIREEKILLVGQEFGLLLHVPVTGSHNQQGRGECEQPIQIRIQAAPP